MYNGEFKGRIKVMILVLFCPNSKYCLLYIVLSPEIMGPGGPRNICQKTSCVLYKQNRKGLFFDKEFCGAWAGIFYHYCTHAGEYQNSSYTASILEKNRSLILFPNCKFCTKLVVPSYITLFGNLQTAPKQHI